MAIAVPCCGPQQCPEISALAIFPVEGSGGRGVFHPAYLELPLLFQLAAALFFTACPNLLGGSTAKRAACHAPPQRQRLFSAVSYHIKNKTGRPS